MRQKEAAQDFYPFSGYRRLLSPAESLPVRFLANSPVSQMFRDLEAHNWAYLIHLVNKYKKPSRDGLYDSAEGRRAPPGAGPASRAGAGQGDAAASQGKGQIANFDKIKEELTCLLGVKQKTPSKMVRRFQQRKP